MTERSYTIEEVRQLRRRAALAAYSEGYSRGLEEGLRIGEEVAEDVLSGNGPKIWTPEDDAEQEQALRKIFASAIPPPLHPRPASVEG